MSSVEMGFIPPTKLSNNKFIVITKSTGSQKENLTQTQSLSEAINFIYKYLYDTNLDNFLTPDAKAENWKYCYPVIMAGDKIDKNYIYAGFSAKGGHEFYIQDDGVLTLTKIDSTLKQKIRFLIGIEPTNTSKNITRVVNEDIPPIWFAIDPKTKKYVNDFNSYIFIDKTIISVFQINNTTRIIPINQE